MAILIPNGKQQFCDGNGAPLSGGSVTTYVPGTTTPVTTYQDSDLTIPNANPLTLDSDGMCSMWIPANVQVQQIVEDSNGVQIWNTNSGLLLEGLTSLNADTTLSITQAGLIQVDAGTGPVTITLPSSASVPSALPFTIQKIDSSANAVTVIVSGTDNINGAASAVIPSQYQCLVLKNGGGGSWNSVMNSVFSAGITVAGTATMASASVTGDLTVGGTATIATAKITGTSTMGNASVTGTTTTANLAATGNSTLGNGPNYAPDTGVANAYVVTLNPAITALVDGLLILTKILNPNNSSSTLNANGLGAKTIYGGNSSVLQGGELIANGLALFEYNATLGGFLLLWSQGALQVPPATQSNHAVSYGQIKNAVAPSASNAANSTTGISATTPSFTAPSKGILYITVTCFNGASGSGSISASASLGAVTAQTSQANYEYYVWRGYIEMNAGDVTTVTGSYSGPNGDPTILVETTFTPNP